MKVPKIITVIKIITIINVIVLAFPPAILAHCPLCVAGAAAGLTLSRVLGIDDSITGVWMAALLGAMAFWAEAKFVKKASLKPILRPVIYIATFGLTIWSFYQFNLVVTMFKLFGVDRLTFGMIVGGVAFYLADAIDDLVIKSTGRVFVPFQRIYVGLGSMVVLSLVMFYLANYA